MPFPGALPASMAKRLLAYVIDASAALALGGAFVVVGLAQMLEAARTGALTTSAAGPLIVVGYVLVAVFGLFQWWYQGQRGYTVGKRVVGLRTLSAVTGQPVGLGRVLLRHLVVAAGSLVLGVGQLVVLVSPFFDTSGRRQGWHDKAAGSMVFDVGSGADPAQVGTSAALAGPDRLKGLLVQAPPAAAGPEAPAGAAVPPPPGPPGPTAVPARVPALVSAPEPDARPPGVPGDALSDQVAEPPSGPERRPVPPAPPVLPAAPATAPTVAEAPAVPGIISSVPGVSSSASPVLPDESAHVRHQPAPVGIPAFIPTAGVPPRPPVELDEDVEATRLTGTARLSALAETASPSATMRLWDDRKVTITGVVLLGRNPAPRDDEPVPERLFAVPDTGRSVSKTHLAVGVDASGVWVRDRHSTNGTVVTLPDRQQIICAGDQEVRVPVGGSVAFGDFWFTIV